MKNTEQTILGLTTKECSEIIITNEKTNFLQKLLKRNIRKYLVYPATLYQLQLISKQLIDAPEFLFKEKTDEELTVQAIEFAAENTDRMVKIAGVFLGEKDYNFLKQSLTAADLVDLLLAALKTADYANFVSSIALVNQRASLK